MQATYKKYKLNFKLPAGTSRGVLNFRETYFLLIFDDNKFGIGECGLFKGLSADDTPDYEQQLQWLCDNIHRDTAYISSNLLAYPSILFGWEQAMLSLKSEQPMLLFPSCFTDGKSGIPINGLIWMGEKKYMLQQIKNKLDEGYRLLKLKVGALDFATECEILQHIRQQFAPDVLEIRLDANGAFTPKNSVEKLNQLADYQIHSIEQPLKAGQWEAMATLCKKTPIPIALDEELIGIYSSEEKKQLLQNIQPQHIILKPTLHGGLVGSKEWIDLAENHSIGWWITSALESNVGLNAIAQFTYQLGVKVPQGLGTGSLFDNNFKSPLVIINTQLQYLPTNNWNLNPIIDKII